MRFLCSVSDSFQNFSFLTKKKNNKFAEHFCCELTNALLKNNSIFFNRCLKCLLIKFQINFGTKDVFDPYKALSQSTRLTTAMTYESATNELPLSSISFAKCIESPDRDKFYKLNFHHYDLNETRHEMSPMATNERPLSCTCLPKLLTDNENPIKSVQGSFDCDNDDEFVIQESVHSSSCPLPHGHFPLNENKIFSADFQERLNDYNASRVQKRSHTPRIFINDELPKISDLKSMQNVKLNTDIINLTNSNSTEHRSIDPFELPMLFRTTKSHSLSKHPVLKKPIVTSSPQLSSDPSVSNAFSRTKPTIISTSSNSNASNNLTNVNNTTIPHPNIVKIHNSDATQSPQTSTNRRQRHSIAGQMGFFKIMDIAGGFSRKMASTNSLFSTAVISGSSSAPNLHQINTTSPSGTKLNSK